MKKTKEKSNLSFEEHLAKAKDIIQKLESADCNLDEMLTIYKEGVDSLNYCTKKLNEIEEKIQIIKNEDSTKLKIDDIKWKLAYM